MKTAEKRFSGKGFDDLQLGFFRCESASHVYVNPVRGCWLNLCLRVDGLAIMVPGFPLKIVEWSMRELRYLAVISILFFYFSCGKESDVSQTKEIVTKPKVDNSAVIAKGESYCGVLFGDDRTECFSTLARTASLDDDAFYLCESRIFVPADRVSCLQAVSNKEYEGYQLSICEVEFVPGRLIDCLDRNGFVSGGGTADVIPELRNYCDTSVLPEQRRECLQEVASTQLIETTALDLCNQRVFVHDQRMQCLRAIKNQVLNEFILEQSCQLAFSIDQILACVESAR